MQVESLTSLPRDPVIEAYKRDVDRTLLRENLKLTTEQRLLQLAEQARLVEEIRKARTVSTQP